MRFLKDSVNAAQVIDGSICKMFWNPSWYNSLTGQ
jgi:hypothetical protein